jgi:hypothetical protein
MKKVRYAIERMGLRLFWSPSPVLVRWEAPNVEKSTLDGTVSHATQQGMYNSISYCMEMVKSNVSLVRKAYYLLIIISLIVHAPGSFEPDAATLAFLLRIS